MKKFKTKFKMNHFQKAFKHQYTLCIYICVFLHIHTYIQFTHNLLIGCETSACLVEHKAERQVRKIFSSEFIYNSVTPYGFPYRYPSTDTIWFLSCDSFARVSLSAAFPWVIQLLQQTLLTPNEWILAFSVGKKTTFLPEVDFWSLRNDLIRISCLRVSFSC